MSKERQTVLGLRVNLRPEEQDKPLYRDRFAWLREVEIVKKSPQIAKPQNQQFKVGDKVRRKTGAVRLWRGFLDGRVGTVIAVGNAIRVIYPNSSENDWLCLPDSLELVNA